MGAKSNFNNIMYKDYEILQAKLDKVLDELSNIKSEHKKEIKELKNKFQLEIYNLNLVNNKLVKELETANKLITNLVTENEKLKNQINKNSSNSSKPSSTDKTNPKPKTGANLYNGREKTNKKVGGQVGHKGHNLSKEKIEKLIDNKKIKVITIKHKINGNKNINLIKYKLGIKILPYVEKHIFIYDDKSKEKLPKEFYTDVTYDNSIKSLSIELGAYNVISYDRLSDFFNVITNGIIDISNGTLVNFLKEFSNKSTETLLNIENNILNSIMIKTDETNSKLNGKNMHVRNYSNEKSVLYKAHKNKGHKPIEEDNILPRFLGGIMGDHDTTLYKYGTKNYECNIHLGRYLEEIIQNVNYISWPTKMKELLFRMNNTKKLAISYGLENFSKEKIEEYEKEFDSILNTAYEENLTIKSSFYKDKANKLYRRIKKYKENHLYFIKDFNVDFDNNLSEQDLRLFKIKTKISGGFRSLKLASDYTNTLSIIKTAIKRNLNPFDAISAIFNNQVLFE